MCRVELKERTRLYGQLLGHSCENLVLTRLLERSVNHTTVDDSSMNSSRTLGTSVNLLCFVFA